MSFIKKLFSNVGKNQDKQDVIIAKNIENDTLNTDNKSEEKQGDYAELTLSLHPTEEKTMSELTRKQLEVDIKRFPPIKKNDINIAGFYVYDNGNNLEVNFCIRNGLERPIRFEDVPLSIINKKGELLAYQKLNLRELGEIDKFSARPYTVYFEKENVFVNEISIDDWEIIFGMRNI